MFPRSLAAFPSMLPVLAFLALAATTLPAGAAEPEAGAPDECTNNGINVQVGPFDCDVCTNHGIVVWVGRTCWGNGPVGACAAEICSTPPHHPTENGA